MSYEEIDERYHDAALDEGDESLDEDAPEREGWDDPVSTDDDLDPDELDGEDADV